MKYTNETFIKKATEKYGNKYTYDKVNYINSQTKVCIICPEHGKFYVRPADYLRGYSCPKCSNIKRIKNLSLTQDEVIRRFHKVHDDKYDYSLVEYVNYDTKVKIICPIHGVFKMTPFNHIQGQGCPKCQSSHLEEEIKSFLNDNDIEFEQQKTFEWLKLKNHLYLDFYLPKYNKAIECQGIQHFKPIDFSEVRNALSKQLNETTSNKNYVRIMVSKSSILLIKTIVITIQQ